MNKFNVNYLNHNFETKIEINANNNIVHFKCIMCNITGYCISYSILNNEFVYFQNYKPFNTALKLTCIEQQIKNLLE